MSRISTLKQWRNSDTVNAKDYVLERDRISVAVNDNYDRLKGLENIVTSSIVTIGATSPFESVGVNNYVIDTELSALTVALPEETEGALVQFMIKAMGDTIDFVGDTYTFQADTTFDGVTITFVYSSGAWFYTVFSSNKHTHENYEFDKSGWEPYTTLTAPKLSWDRATNTITYVNAGGIRFWTNNEVFTKLEDSIILPNVTGEYYIYYDGNDTLVYNSLVWSRSLGHCPVAYVSWNAENSIEIIIGFEFHTTTMDWATHEHFHNTFGTLYVDGLVGTAMNDMEVRYSVGTVRDEDIKLGFKTLIGALQPNEPLEAPKLYRLPNGDFIKEDAVNTEIVVREPGGVMAVNPFNSTTGLWELLPVTNNRYFAVWVVMTNDIDNPIMVIPGQVESDSLRNALNDNELLSMQFGDLPMAEFVVLDRIILRRTGATYEINEITTYRAGRVNSILVNIADHEHDDRYYTEDEINDRSTLTEPTLPTLGSLWFDD